MSRTIKTPLGFQGHFKEYELHLPEGEPDPWSPSQPLQVVGTAVPRLEAQAKVTGAALYTADIQRPGMLYARILRARVACGTVKKVDVSKAKALPGVRAVVVVPHQKVRYAGQELAAVAAINSRVAEDAIRLIEVEIDPENFVVHLDAALEPTAPAVYPPKQPPKPNTSPNARPTRLHGFETGSPSEGFKAADKTVTQTFRTQVQMHTSLEPHGVVAEWNNNKLTVWASTQATFSVRDELAQSFNLPQSDVVVITEHMGGGFGSKFGAGVEGVLAAKLAKATNAPVKLMLTRKEEQTCTGYRPDSKQTLSVGLRRDGALSAMQAVSYGSTGLGSGGGTARPFQRLYTCSNLRIEEYDVHTHTNASRAFRAPGHPQGVFALESIVDMCAEQLGIDPLQFRLRHDPHDVRKAQMQLGAQRMGWHRRNSLPGTGTSPIKSGLGMASGLWYNTGREGTQIEIKLYQDGSVEVLSGGQDIGTGIRTLIGMVVAEELGLPLSAVSVKIGDTRYPYAPGSGGSKTTPCVAPTARRAAFQAKQMMLPLARRLLRLASHAPVLLKDGKFVDANQPNHSLTWKQVARRLPQSEVRVQVTRPPNYETYNNIIAGVQFAEVEVNTDTGQIKVRKVVAVHDCGRVLNRLTATSQINGGVIQGLSYALFENRVMDSQKGLTLNPNLEQYKIAGSLDIPEIDVVLFDVYAGSNNTQALGLGEPATVPTCAAIANAVAHAIGARIDSLPITPARVLAALAQKRKGGQ